MSRKIVGVTVGTPISPERMHDKMHTVKSVNGVTPDENGNVELELGSGEPSDGGVLSARVVQTASGATILITDKNGSTEATITHGKDGKDGSDGKDGYTPQKGIDYFDGVDGKDGYTPVKGVDYFDGSPGKDGVDGKDGSPGADGYTPIKGKDYFDGQPGQDGSPGKDGSDGVSATHSWNGTVLTVTSASGISSADLKGEPGKDGSNGQPGADGISPTVAVTKSGKVTTVSITDKNGTKTATINDGADGSPGSAGKDGTSMTVKSVSESTADGGSNVVTFSDGKTLTVKNGSKGSTGSRGDTGATGQRGTGLLPVTTAPSGYTTEVGGITPKYRMAISTIKTQAGVTEVLLGDTVRYSYYHYPIAYLDASYAYFTTRVSIRGASGAAGADGLPGTPGSDGVDGYTPVKGVDYYTDAEKEEWEAYIATELAKRGQLKPEFANSTAECTDTTKLYVLPDGMIYAYMLTEIETGPAYTNQLPISIKSDKTAYVGANGEKGYNPNFRVSSSGSEKAATGYYATGFIPVKKGDTVRIKGMNGSDANGYCVAYYYTSTFAVGASPTYTLLSLTADGNNVRTFSPANADTAYMRITFMGNPADIIITVNEEITESGGTTTGYAWASTGHAFVPADYEDRIVDLEALTAEHSEDIENLKNGAVNVTDITKWDAPIYDANIPVFQLSAEKAAMTNGAQTPADIYSKYDALMAKHPHYITKTDLGLCSDGVNHVYRYDFREPDSRHTSGMQWSETKTKAIIVSGIHYEWAGIYGLYYALEEITENPELYSFRRNSHLIVVPCMNPYATIAGNYSDSVGVKNANGVEIHRNFEVGWVLTEAGTTHYGGAEPLSEVETQYVDAIMQENTDAALFLTCHNFGDEGFNFIWPSTATPYMCNMGYRLIDKLSNIWLDKYGDELVGLEDYRTSDIPSWDNRLGFAHISATPGTETRQGTKYGIQSANVEINGRFWVHGTKASPEPAMSAFTMSRGAEVYVNFLLTAFGVYDPKDKALYG